MLIVYCEKEIFYWKYWRYCDKMIKCGFLVSDLLKRAFVRFFRRFDRCECLFLIVLGLFYEVFLRGWWKKSVSFLDVLGVWWIFLWIFWDCFFISFFRARVSEVWSEARCGCWCLNVCWIKGDIVFVFCSIFYLCLMLILSNFFCKWFVKCVIRCI